MSRHRRPGRAVVLGFDRRPQDLPPGCRWLLVRGGGIVAALLFCGWLASAGVP